MKEDINPTVTAKEEDFKENCWPVSDTSGRERVKQEGCSIDNQSSMLKVGEHFEIGNHTYECQKRFNGFTQMCAVGCIYNGNHFKIGEQFMDGEFVFYCKSGKNGKICQRVCIGCQVGDQKLYNGDRYRKDNSAYQCVVRPNRSIHKPVACFTEGGIERVVGCKWRTTTKHSSRVEQTCVVRKGRSLVETTGCVFNHKGYDRFFLYTGTYTLWSEFSDGQKMGVKCATKEQKSTPLLETFSLAEMEGKTVGLKYDQPRG